MDRWTTKQPKTGGKAALGSVGLTFCPPRLSISSRCGIPDTFDMPTITRELGWAADIGFNAIRVNLPLSWLGARPPTV